MMRYFARAASGFILHLVLATTLYGWMHVLVRDFASGRLLTPRHWPVTLGFAAMVVVLLCVLCRKSRFMRSLALLICAVAALHVIVETDHVWLAVVVGGFIFAVVEARILGNLRAAFSGWTSRGRQCQPTASGPTPTPVSSPETQHSFDDLITEPQIDFSTIVGMASTKARLLAAGREILENPGSARNGLLLSGEPGNGKTTFAQALAGELEVPFFSLDYGAVASRWVNETPARVRAAFAQARKLGRAVLFIDEFDSFVKSRDGAHHMDVDLSNVMLAELSRLRGTRVILIVATNRIGSLDSASIREGRFDFKIEIPPPDLEARKAILRRSVGEAMGFHALAAPMLTSLAIRWEGFSAARLASIGRELADMRREGAISAGGLTFDAAMSAMRRLQGSKGKLPEHVKSIDEIIMPHDSRSELRDLAFRLRNVYSLEQLGGRLPSGVLFYGPPGTGKTLGAMALAAASGYAFLKTTGAELLGNPSAWDQLIRDAKNLRPAIVFIDEAEDVLRDRLVSGVAPVTNRLLATLDGASGRVPDILYVCATNHPDVLDAAVLRGGRLEQKIRFDAPSDESLASYIRGHLRAMAGDVFALSRHTMDCAVVGLRGCAIGDVDAVLQRIIDAAAVRHLREGSAVITAADVRAALRTAAVQY